MTRPPLRCRSYRIRRLGAFRLRHLAGALAVAFFCALPCPVPAAAGEVPAIGPCCDGNGVMRIEIDAQDALRRVGIAPLQGEDRAEAFRVIDAERANALRFASASMKLTITATGAGEEPQPLEGTLVMQRVDAPAGKGKGDLPWAYRYTFTAAGGKGNVTFDGATRKPGVVTALDEKTRNQLAELTASGYLFDVLTLPQQVPLGLYPDAARPPYARAVELPAGARRSLVAFALLSAKNPRAKTFLFRHGHFHQFIVPPNNSDGDDEKTFTFERYRTTPEGFAYPTEITMEFHQSGYKLRLTVAEFAATLQSPPAPDSPNGAARPALAPATAALEAADTLDRSRLRQLQGEELKQAHAVLEKQWQLWWKKEFAFTGDLVLKRIAPNTEPQELHGRLVCQSRWQPTTHRQFHRSPWTDVFTLTDPDNRWKIVTDGDGKEPDATVITAGDEATRLRLRELTDNGGLLGMLLLPRECVIAGGCRFVPALTQQTGNRVMYGAWVWPSHGQPPAPNSTPDFALLENDTPAAQAMLFRDGRFYALTFPPKKPGGKASALHFPRYATLADGAEVPEVFTTGEPDDGVRITVGLSNLKSQPLGAE